MPRVLILCTGNSCRSQMAEALLRSFDPALEVHSAGTSPAQSIHPMALQVLEEIGLRPSLAHPKNVDEFLSQAFDYVVTVCDHAKETCPVFVGKIGKHLHIGFKDPGTATGTEEEILAEFRRVRDEIHREFKAFYHAQIRPKGT